MQGKQRKELEEYTPRYAENAKKTTNTKKHITRAKEKICDKCRITLIYARLFMFMHVCACFA